MARDHARIDVSIWDDPDFINLSAEAQRLYLFLLSQRDLSYCGALPLRVRRWARHSASATPDSIAAALGELDGARMVVVDHDAEEVLIRSFIRRDGLWKSPNVLAAALREAFEVASVVLRTALAAELRRLPAEVTGPAPEVAAAALGTSASVMPAAVKVALSDRRRCGAAAAVQVPAQPPAPAIDTMPAAPAEVPATAPPAPVAELVTVVSSTTAHQAREGSGNPSPNPSRQSQGEGSREGVVSVGPVTSGDSSVQGGPAPARTRVYVNPGATTRTHVTGITYPSEAAELAARLVAETVPAQPAAVTGGLVDQAAGLLVEGIAPRHVVSGLRRWTRKRVGSRLLPELVADEMRAEVCPRENSTDERIREFLGQAARCAVEDQDDTEVGRWLRGAVAGERLGAVPLALEAFMPAVAA